MLSGVVWLGGSMDGACVWGEASSLISALGVACSGSNGNGGRAIEQEDAKMPYEQFSEYVNQLYVYLQVRCTWLHMAAHVMAPHCHIVASKQAPRRSAVLVGGMPTTTMC